MSHSLNDKMDPARQLAGRTCRRLVLQATVSPSPPFTPFSVHSFGSTTASIAPSLYNLGFGRRFSNTPVVQAVAGITTTATYSTPTARGTAHPLWPAPNVGRIARDGLVALRYADVGSFCLDTRSIPLSSFVHRLHPLSQPLSIPVSDSRGLAALRGTLLPILTM